MARPKNSTTLEANALAEEIGLHCHPLERADAHYDLLLAMVGEARWATLAPATWGAWANGT
jgi:hypothetical protein